MVMPQGPQGQSLSDQHSVRFGWQQKKPPLIDFCFSFD